MARILTGSLQMLRLSSTPAGERWTLRSWIEMGKTLMPPDTSNFCAVTAYPEPRPAGGGVSYFIVLPKGGPEIALIQRINNAPYGSPAWHYLVRPGSPGSLYQTMAAEDDTPADLRWFPIAIGSKGGAALAGPRSATRRLHLRHGMGEEPLTVRNQLRITGGWVNGFVPFAGIRRAADYSQYSPATHPWFFAHVWCAYGEAGKVPNRIGETPQGVLFMPIFHPADFAGSQEERGLWLDPAWLLGRVS